MHKTHGIKQQSQAIIMFRIAAKTQWSYFCAVSKHSKYKTAKRNKHPQFQNQYTIKNAIWNWKLELFMKEKTKDMHKPL